MKKLILSAFVVASMLVAAPQVNAQTVASAAKSKTTKNTKVAGVTYKIDPASSNLAWDGKKVTGAHNGTLKIADGSIQVDKNKVVAGTIEMDMASIENLDIKDADNNKKLIGHLKSEDFFSVEKHPRATFKITSVTPIKGAAAGAPNYNVAGNLTIKGITNPVTFPAQITANGNTVVAKSEAVTLDRTKWDIRYGSKSFFANIGDKAIMDDFNIQFNIVAKK